MSQKMSFWKKRSAVTERFYRVLANLLRLCNRSEPIPSDLLDLVCVPDPSAGPSLSDLYLLKTVVLNRRDWYPMANFRIEYASRDIQHNMATIGFDPRFIRVNPRLNSLFIAIYRDLI
jgi:hypothetical protein